MIEAILDANILVYAFDVNSDFHKKSVDLIQSQKTFATPYNCLLEFYRTVSSKPFEKNISLELALEAFEYLSKTLTILYPDQETAYILSDLIGKFKPRSGKIFDLSIVAHAYQNKIPKIITKNLKDFPTTDFVEIVDLNQL